MRLYDIITEGKKYFPSSPLPDYKADDIYTMSEPVSTDFDNEYADDPMSRLANDLDNHADIAYGLSKLTDRERYVITMRYGLSGRPPMSLDAIGASMNKLNPGDGVGRERVRQIEAKALRKLRHPSRQLDPITEATPSQAQRLQDHDWRSPAEVVRWLRHKGYTQKGAGVYSRVFLHPKQKTIIKVSKQEDECWLRFAYWTLKMSSHPNVPYIHWIRQYGKGDKFFIAEIEKLLPYNRFAIMNTVDVVGLAFLYTDVEGEFLLDENIEDRLMKEGILKLSYDNGADYFQEDPYQTVWNWLGKARGGKRFINVIKKYENMIDISCEDDLHAGNIMYRPSDRRLVITDPLAG